METIKIECESCDGTGIYKGMCEKDGSAVVCIKCQGTGMIEFNYTPFTERKLRTDVKRVYSNTMTYVISDEDFTTKEGVTIHMSQFGASYEDWLNGKKPIPIKELVCPYYWSDQEFKWKLCNDLLGGCYYNCPHYADKDACWFQFEQNEKKKELKKVQEYKRKYAKKEP